jgi:hypothetical protein
MECYEMRQVHSKKAATAIAILLLMVTLASFLQSGIAQTNIQDPHLTRALEWVVTSKMIVDNPSDPLYNNTFPPKGGVYFVYDTNKSQLGKTIHVPAAAEYVKLCSDLYQGGYEPAVKDRLIIVADFLVASTTKINLDGSTLTVVATIWQYTQGKGWNPSIEEYYTRDTLNVAQALMRAYQVTENEGYASKARELLNTVVSLQTMMEKKILQGDLPDWTTGALPWIMYNYEGGSNYNATIKDLDLTLTDVAWGALTLGYNQDRNSQYLQCRDKYFGFLLSAYQRDQNVIRYPYQFISNRASPALYFANYDPVNKEWGPTDPFTTDSAFYQITGFLENENATIKALGDKFLNEISLLQQGAFFEDSYYTNGESVGYGKAIIATGQLLTILKLKQNLAGQNENINAVFSLQLYDATNAGTTIYNGAWDWSPNSTLVESMATIIVIHSLIITPEMIPKTNAPQTNLQFPIQAIIIVIAAIVIALALTTVYLIRKRKTKLQT